MQQILQTFIQATVIALILFSQQALATDCYEQSPNFDDQYYNLEDKATLSYDEKNALRQFLNSIRGRWAGQMQYIECRGPDSAPRIITKTATLTTKNKFSNNGSISAQAEKTYTEERIKKLETLNLMGNNNVFNFAIEPGSQVTFSEKYRRQNNVQPKIDKTKPSSNNQTIIDKTSNTSRQVITTYQKEKKKKTSRITETIYDMTLNGSQLIISRAYYTNGVYTGQEIWRLSPN